MPLPLNAPFVKYAADILGDTNFGLSGGKIASESAAFAVEFGVDIPHATYPFGADVPNKRTALYQNLLKFSEPQRYALIRALCEHDGVKDRDEVKKLKLMLISRYGHLANETIGSELDQELIERTKHWLAEFPEALAPYNEAIQKHANEVFLRNVLDDMRLALELLLKAVLGNEKSLENQIQQLGGFIKEKGGSPELANMFVKLVDYYAKYQNSYVKHDDAVIEEEVEFIIELTSSFMKHLVRLSYR